MDLHRGTRRLRGSTVKEDRELSDLPVLSVVLPMWNEQAMIRRAVAAAEDLGTVLVADGAIADLQVVVVDDGSTDDTTRIADEIAAGDDHVTVVHHDRNRSLGTAIRSGIKVATGDVVLLTGADLPFDLLETRRALRLMDTFAADIVAPYRFDRTGEGPRRFIYSHVYNWLVRCVFGLRIRDVNFAAKLIRREVLDRVELRSSGSFIDVELLAKATRQGFSVVQFGVDYFPRSRGVSTMSSAPVIATMLTEMAQLAPEIRAAGPRR